MSDALATDPQVVVDFFRACIIFGVVFGAVVSVFR